MYCKACCTVWRIRWMVCAADDRLMQRFFFQARQATPSTNMCPMVQWRKYFRTCRAAQSRTKEYLPRSRKRRDYCAQSWNVARSRLTGSIDRRRQRPVLKIIPYTSRRRWFPASPPGTWNKSAQTMETNNAKEKKWTFYECESTENWTDINILWYEACVSYQYL